MKIVSIIVKTDNPVIPPILSEKRKENGTGLCNQIFRIINTIGICDPFNNDIYFDLMSKDISSGEMINISDIVDLDSIRVETGWRVYDILDLKDYEDIYIHNDLYVFRVNHNDYNLFNHISKNIKFQQKYEGVSIEIIKKVGLYNSEVNLVHLRIDEDMKNHILRCVDNQGTIGDINNDNIIYYNEIIERYRSQIYENCDKSMPLVLLLEDTNHDFVRELSKDYDIIFFDKEVVRSEFKKMNGEEINGREIFALIDLLIGKNLNVNNFIGLDNQIPLSNGLSYGSSFSIFLNSIINKKSYIRI